MLRIKPFWAGRGSYLAAGRGSYLAVIDVDRGAVHTMSRRTTRRRTLATAHVSREQPDDIEVIELDRAEYDEAVKAELDKLGMTYKQLEREARRGIFRSLRARKLWLAIGEPHGAEC